MFLFVTLHIHISTNTAAMEKDMKDKIKELEQKMQLTHIIQPNAITNAKYDYSAVQKNILYEAISQIQSKMTDNKLDRNLFGSIYIKVPITKIAGKRNHPKVYEAAEDLISKKFHYNWKNERGKEVKTTTALVASVTHEKNSKFLVLNIPEEVVPVLLYIGEGFTKYQKVIAITLKSVHAKRMYELCNRWKDLSGFTCKLDEFKEMMALENKYGKLSMLKARVLEVAKKELDERAEIGFEYNLTKKNSRQFNYIHFKIYDNKPIEENDGESILTTDQQLIITNMLDIPYPLIKNSKAVDLTHKIAAHEEFEKIYLRIVSLRKELQEGKKTRKDVEHLLPYILKEDFKISD